MRGRVGRLLRKEGAKSNDTMAEGRHAVRVSVLCPTPLNMHTLRFLEFVLCPGQFGFRETKSKKKAKKYP